MPLATPPRQSPHVADLLERQITAIPKRQIGEGRGGKIDVVSGIFLELFLRDSSEFAQSI
jgi:hypothetical protein